MSQISLAYDQRISITSLEYFLVVGWRVTNGKIADIRQP